MGSITGYRINYNGVGALGLRGWLHIPNKMESRNPPPPPLPPPPGLDNGKEGLKTYGRPRSDNVGKSVVCGTTEGTNTQCDQ